MNKRIKCILLFTVLFCAAALSAQAAVLPSIQKMAAGVYDSIDYPFSDGLMYFFGAAGSFRNIAVNLSVLVGVICILWNVFRLWMGTEQIRKAVTDIIVKFTLFLVIMLSYQNIITAVLDISHNIGAYAGGGAKKIEASFFSLYNGLTLMKTTMQTNAMMEGFAKGDKKLAAYAIN